MTPFGWKKVNSFDARKGIPGQLLLLLDWQQEQQNKPGTCVVRHSYARTVIKPSVSLEQRHQFNVNGADLVGNHAKLMLLNVRMDEIVVGHDV